MNDKPTIICLCGSTRFADHHAVMRWELEKQGAIVLMINYLPAWYADSHGWEGNDHFGEKAGLKEQLDELHLRKIDLSDKVLVLNVDGYIGESTRREIEYAESIGRPVEYLEPIDRGPSPLQSAVGVWADSQELRRAAERSSRTGARPIGGQTTESD